MQRTNKYWLSAWCIVLAVGSPLVWAQDPSANATKSGPRPNVAQPQPSSANSPKIPSPKFLNLRFDEDFSYLDGAPGSYRTDFFDPIKNIPLGEDWRLTLGGEFRFRMEAETNKRFDANPRTQDTFQLYRYMIHADFRFRNTFRVFVQGVSAFDEKRSLAKRGIDENRWDLQQLFFDVRILGDDSPFTLRVGRQDLLYGNQRLVSPLDWANVRRRFDAVKLFAKGKIWDVDVWYAKPVVVKRRQGDDFNEQLDFYGAYVTYKAIPRHGLDLYAFAIDDTGNRRNPNGKRGDITRFTFGSRFWGKTSGFDYEAELAGQWGRWAGDTIQAWSWTVNGGYTFAEARWKPRLGLGFDWASGDRNPRDGKVGTFDQHFPLGHKYFGFLDLIGRQNITALNLNVTAWPVPKKVKAAAAFHSFWLSSRKDALYNAGGAPTRRDVTGHSGREIGHELDLTLAWKLDAHQAVLLGYSHFWDSNFIINTGKSEDVDLFYVQYQFKF